MTERAVVAAVDQLGPTLRPLPTLAELKEEMTIYGKATTGGHVTQLSTYRMRLADFLAAYPDPQAFFELDIAAQIEALQTDFPATKHFRKVLAFLWIHDYARPSFDLLWSVRFDAALKDGKQFWAEELRPFREMAARIGYRGQSIDKFENRLVEIFLATGKRRLSQLTFLELEALYARVDKTRAPDQSRKDVAVLANGVKVEVRWNVRGISKVLMAMGMEGFEQPIERRYSRESMSLEEYFEPITNPLTRDSLIQYCREMSTIRRPGTIGVYRRALLDFALYIQTNFPELRSYGELQRVPHITGWLQHLSERESNSRLAVSRAGYPRPKLTDEARRKIIYNVSAFLNRLAMWEHPNAPTRVLFDKDDAPRHEEPLPFALEDWQAHKIIEAAHKTSNLLGKAATLMLLRTGMRIGEFLLLETNSFVRRKDPVSGREVTWIRVPIIKLGRGREVPLAFDDVEQAVEEWNAHRPFLPKHRHPRTGKLVEFWLAGGNGYGSPGQPISYVAVLRALDQVVQEAGLNSDEVWPHRYRHTLGTLLINQPDVKEATVSRLLGHGPDRSMTSRYAKIKDRTLLNDMEKLHETLNDLFPEGDGSTAAGVLEIETPRLRELRIAAQKAWRDQGYCYCTRSENTFCVAEESCLKCELATFGLDHLEVLKRMAADAEGKGQVKRLSLIVKAIQRAQGAVRQTSVDSSDHQADE